MTIQPLHEAILAGVNRLLCQYFNLQPSQVLSIAATNQIATATKVARSQGADTVFPIMLVSLSSMTAQSDATYNPRTLARMGVYGKVNSNSSSVSSIKMVPATFEFNVRMLIQDLPAALELGRLWVVGSIIRPLNFTIDYYGSSLDIAVSLSDTFSTPDKEVAIDSANFFDYTGTITVKGYLNSTVETIPLVKSIVLNVGTTEKVSDPQVYGEKQ